MRKILTTSIIFSVLAFLAGYFVATQKEESVIAEHELAALMHYTTVLAYLQKGQVENAKYLLYVGSDGSIGTLSKNNAAALSITKKEILKTTLIHLNQSWAKDKPFDTEKSASLTGMPEWLEMRQKNDTFRNGYVNEK